MGGKRKKIVYFSGLMMTAACLCFGVFRSYAIIMLLGLWFGIGFGAFSTMDWYTRIRAVVMHIAAFR